MPRRLFELLELNRPLQVADIGAAYISETPTYKAMLDQGVAELNAFDADVRQHAPMRTFYGEGLRIFPQVVGDGTVQTLHLASPASGMTSLLRPSAAHLAFFNGFQQFGEIESETQVETSRLDDVPGLPDLDFLKMDIQGAELQVLKHGRERLARCAMVQLEVSFVPLYEGQPCFGEVDVWMRSQGFIPHCFTEVKRWSIAPVVRQGNFRMPFNQLLEADIVYVRDPVSPGALDTELMKITALLAHSQYGSIDLAGRLILQMTQAGVLPEAALAAYMALTNGPAQAR